MLHPILFAKMRHHNRKKEKIMGAFARSQVFLTLGDLGPKPHAAQPTVRLVSCTHLDVVAQFLPALLMPCSRRSRVRQIVSNTKRFARGMERSVGNRLAFCKE